MDNRKIAFLVIFIVASLVASRIIFAPLLGVDSKTLPGLNEKSFTFFQFLAPIGGGLFDPLFGAGAALLAQLAGIFLFGDVASAFGILRLSTGMCAAWYFGSKGKEVLFVPVFCMVLFWMHPVGGQAPYYALFWIIPIAAKFAGGNLLMRSLGATFTAHAVGSVAFIYTIATEPGLWITLIPVVFFERFVFTVGIAVSYVAMNTLLGVLSTRFNLKALNIEKKYSLVKA